VSKKAAALFPGIATAEGNLKNLDTLKDAFVGHTRLVIIFSDLTLDMELVKKTVSQYAYEAGVKQIVDISSITAGFPWKTTFIGDAHYRAERAISSIPNRGTCVTLRPGRFMSNMLNFDRVHPDNVIRDTQDPNESVGWVSPNDIAAVAAAVVTEDVEKHGDLVYELIGDSLTQTQRAEVLSRVLDKTITFQRIKTLDKYNNLIRFGFPHVAAFGLCSNPLTAPPDGIVSTAFPILIGREPETLEEYAIKNKHAL
jgi:uncharacterized protein YbjT (DUF2867 family)